MKKLSEYVDGWYINQNDERRRPRRDAPAAVQLQKIFLNLPAPPCLGEVLRRAILQKYPYFAEKFHQ
jgi:hypothetical protein